MRRILVAAVLVAATFRVVAAQPAIDYATLEIRTTDMGHGLYLLNWQGGDSLFLVSDDGVLLVDTSAAPMRTPTMTRWCTSGAPT